MTAGRIRAVWVKVGVAVRLCQDLQLQLEPGPNISPVDREEKRRLFWSVYLLDRFACCTKQKSPGMWDVDCQVQLPSGEAAFCDGRHEDTNYLMEMISPREPSTYEPGHFASLVLMSCALGRCTRYMFDERRSFTQMAPWNPDSEYQAISSILLHFESLADVSLSFEHFFGADMLTPDGKLHQQKAGHAVFTRIAFHLCHALLNHPFLLRRLAGATRLKMPVTWLSKSLRLGLEHARLLSTFLKDAHSSGYVIDSPFHGYCLLVTGGIHAMYSHSRDPTTQRESAESLEFDLEALDKISQVCPRTKMIVSTCLEDVNRKL